MDLDSIVSASISAGESALDKKANSNEKQTSGQIFLRFVVSFVWVLVAVIASTVGLIAVCFHGVAEFLGEHTILGYIGIGLPLVIFIITFIVPYLRKKGTTTRWCGITCLGDAIWWAYIIFSESGETITDMM